MRAGMGGPTGLDFGAVLMMADAMGADRTLIADVLPEVEIAVVNGIQRRLERDAERPQ